MYKIYFILERLYIFRTVFQPIIRYCYCLLASRQQYLFDKCLLLCVQY